MTETSGNGSQTLEQHEPISPWPIPEELRPFYRVDRHLDGKRLAEAGPNYAHILTWVNDRAAVAWYTKHAEAGDRGFLKSADVRGMRHSAGRTEVSGVAGGFVPVPTVTPDDIDEWLHEFRLIDARRALEDQQRRASVEQERRQRATCAICEQYDPARLSSYRPLTVEGGEPGGHRPQWWASGPSSLHAHLECLHVVEQEGTARWAAQDVDGVSRLERVRGYLDRSAGPA